MSRRLFKVDLSDAARDFQATATEPGLAMLDRNNANYNSLRRWLGDYVAEPEWLGQDVHFFVRLEDRGRLENVHCVPCTKQDLLGPLQPQLEELDQKLRRARPETANEQLLHRIARKQYADLTRDYDSSDFHCYFFKYRTVNEPWRLVWCWGYQRTDVEPARPLICGNQDCEALYVKRPRQKARCPVCASVATRGRKPPAPLWLRIAQLALLLFLLAGLGWFFVANRPRLVATPDHKIVPPGSRVPYKVNYKRWFFFNDDVTDYVVPQSDNQRVVRFDPSGALAKARAKGNAKVKFFFKNMEANATLTVTAPKQPKSIKLEPAGHVTLGIGTTKKLQLIGTYDAKEKLDPVELTDAAQWNAEKPNVVYVHQSKPGVLEGATEGQTKVTAGYRATDKDKLLEVSTDAFVTEVEFKSIELALTPKSFGLGQGAKIEATGISKKDGQKYSLSGSSLLKLSIDPTPAADVDGEYLVGIQKGKAKLNATLFDLKASTDFEVTDSLLAAGTFFVSPDNAELYVDEYLDLDVITGDAALLNTTSSNPKVVEVIGGAQTEPNRRISIAGRGPGKATITVKQGGNTKTIDVTVTPSDIVTLHIDPPAITVESGSSRPFRVYGLTSKGNQIDVAPSRLTWVKQPPLEYAELNRDSLELFGVLPSGGMTFALVAQLGNNAKMQAASTVRVGSTDLAVRHTVVEGVDEFLAWPPISAVGGGRVITVDAGPYFTKDELVYQKGRGLVVNDVGEGAIFGSLGVPPNVVISSYGGTDLTGMSLEEIRRVMAQRPPTDGMEFVYIDSTGARIRSKFGLTLVQDVRLVDDPRSENVTGSDFNAVLNLALRYAGDYRVTTAEGEPLTDWAELGPTPLATITTGKINRSDTDKYEVFVERKIGDELDRFQIKFNLTTQSP